MRTKNERVKQRGMRSWKRFYTYAALTAAITSVGLFSTACSEEAATRTIRRQSVRLRFSRGRINWQWMVL